jgi:hypothetical protein
MDGFEERRPGVVGGWIEAAGSIVGIEIAAAGEARVGEYIRDAGGPVASGRWAFGWTASRRGFETTDGGMTWAKEIPLPDPIASGRAVRERACGPIGCIAAGWLRVGWGVADREPPAEPPPPTPPPTHSAPSLELDCDPTMGPPAPEPPPERERIVPRRPVNTATARSPASGVYAGSTWGAVSSLPAFAGRGGPPMPADDLGLSVEASNGIDRAWRGVPLGRIYAWGPKSGEWDQLGRWQVRWQWPWGGWPDVRSSMVVAAPWTSLDAGRRALGIGPGPQTFWAIAEGDDADHALLLARHAPGSAVELLVLEADRPPLEARRSSGDAFADLEGATRMGGRWYIATGQGPGETDATIVWLLDGATARELVRVPRAGFESRPALRLARHTEGRAVGLVVDGQPDESRGTTQRWVAGIDVESRSIATPEPLAPVDLSDRTVSLCTGDDAGWEVDLPYPGTVRLRIGAGWTATLEGPVARMRLSRQRACVERVLGAVDSYASAPAEALTKWIPRAREQVHMIDASIFAARTRYALRCAGRTSQL